MMDIVTWIIVGSLIVLIIMNPKGFATDITAIGSVVGGESALLSGQGYKPMA
jgi:hypothetical protein